MQYVLHCINNDSFNKYLCLPLSVCTAKICIFKQYLKCVEHPLLIGLGVQNFAWMVHLGGRTNLGGAPTHSLNFIFLDHPSLPTYLLKSFQSNWEEHSLNRGVSVYYKPVNTLQQLLWEQRTQLTERERERERERVAGPVYQINCTNCDMFYIGETERSLKAQFMEHWWPSTATSEVSRHINHECPTHIFCTSNTKILPTEPRWFGRGNVHQDQKTTTEHIWRLSQSEPNLLRKQLGKVKYQNSHFTVSDRIIRTRP